MSIANEITRLQTSKADSKAQINIDKDIINDGIDFINNEKVDSYDEKIAEMQDAYKAFIPINTTSDTQINALKGGVIIGKDIKGNTTQYGTPTPSSPIVVNNVTGLQTIGIGEKNLFKPTLGTTTVNGVTFTKNNDGTYTANGTASDFIGLEIGQFIFGSAKIITYSGAPSNASMSTYSFNLKKEEGATKTWLQDELGTGKTITTEANVIYLATLVIRKGVSVSNIVFKPMIELGSTKTEFEPFKGKQYEINLGKNLLEPKMATATYNGITCKNNGDGSFTLNGTATANATFRLDQSTYDGRDNLKHYSGTYTLSCNELQTNTRLIVMQNQTWASLLYLANTTSTTGTFDKPNCFIYVQVDSGKTVDNLTIRPMLEKGPVATSYSPYFTPIELNKIGNYQDFIRKGTGKNLFDKDTITNGKYITDSGGEGTNNTTFYSDFIPVEPNTKYYVSGRNNGWGNEAFYDSNKTFISRPNEANNIFTTTSTTYYIRVNGHLNDVNNLQIEQGTTATYYEPYGYKDQWYIEKNVLKLVVPNAVTGTLQNSNKRFYVNGMEFGTSNILKNTSNSQTYGLYCDILEEKTAGQTWNGTQGISYDYNSGMNLGCIDFAINGLTTVAEYQNILKGKVIYAIANTPEYTLIENEELIEQLDRIMQLYEGQNNILVTGDLAATLDLDYIVKAENHL